MDFPRLLLLSQEEKSVIQKQVKEKIRPAIEAMKILEQKIPQQALTQILYSAGSTKEELEKGELHSPLDDIIAWGEKYQKTT